MVKTKTGDLFSSQAQTLVNTINCVGIMGKGIAWGFKERFPDMYKEYVRLCDAKRVRLGEPYLYKQLARQWILNFPTKDHWRSVSKLSDIVAGLKYLENNYEEWGIQSLAVPPLGCGNGGLEWRVIGPTLYRHLSRLHIPVELYAPLGTNPIELTPEFLNSESRSVSQNSPSAASTRVPASALALVEVLQRVVSEPYHWPVGRTTFQKIAYFATEAGIPTGLSFTKGSYGPFSADLKALLTILVNNGLIEEQPLGQKMLTVFPGKTFRDARKTFEVELAQWDVIIEHIADLFMRMRTTQAEIAASVLFMARTLPKPHQDNLTEIEVLRGVMDWKIKKRPPLNAEEVAQTVRNLNILRWVDLKPSELPIPAEAWS